MCIPGKEYVEAKVYTRLVERGVPPHRASAVARKVGRHYAIKASKLRGDTKHLPPAA